MHPRMRPSQGLLAISSVAVPATAPCRIRSRLLIRATFPAPVHFVSPGPEQKSIGCNRLGWWVMGFDSAPVIVLDAEQRFHPLPHYRVCRPNGPHTIHHLTTMQHLPSLNIFYPSMQAHRLSVTRSPCHRAPISFSCCSAPAAPRLSSRRQRRRSQPSR